MGGVVGDALGVPVEFKARDTYKITDMIGYGTYNQKPGTWSDDSSMTIATLESMGRLGVVSPTDIMENFYKWLSHGEFTPYGEVFDVGGATRKVLARFAIGTDPLCCGGQTRMDNGNGALMRILPVAMIAPHMVEQVAKLTHAHDISCVSCAIYTAMVQGLLQGKDKERAFADTMDEFQDQINEREAFKRLPTIPQLIREEIKSSGYVVDTLEAALWCFLKTGSYQECVLTAVNLGEDTDTIAAIAGGLAGIYYGGGDKGIPEAWIRQIPRGAEIAARCQVVEEKFGIC